MSTPGSTAVFREIGALLGTAVVCGAVALPLRQPTVVSFMVAGILVGPAGLGWVTARTEIELLARIGVALLLFLVGLKLDVQVIRTVGPVALATGLGQVLFTSIVGYGLCRALDLAPLAAMYLAVAATFSSTIIIVKLLSDKRELTSLHGQISVGFLIVQDLVAVLAILGLSAAGRGGAEGVLPEIGRLLGLGAAALVGLALLSRTLLPVLLGALSRSSELLLLFSVSWALVLATLGEASGLGAEVGAFLAGLCLAATPYREAIGSRLTGLRDFMLLFFFLDLGANLDLGSLAAQLLPGLALSLFVLVGNPLIVMAIMGWMGYRKRTGLLAGLVVAQISEFSLILGNMGLAQGHLEPRHVSLLTLVGLVTISISSYMVLFGARIYDQLAPWLDVFERADPYRERVPGEADWGTKGIDTLVFGAGSFGLEVARGLAARGRRLLVVDFDPEEVEAARAEEISAVLGDVEDPELLEHLPLDHADMIVSTLRLPRRTRRLLSDLQGRGFPGAITVTAEDEEEVEELRAAGAAHVLVPALDAARRAVNILLGPPGPDPEETVRPSES